MASQSVQLPVEAKIAVGVFGALSVFGMVVVIRKWVKDGEEQREAKKAAEKAAVNVANETKAWTDAGQQPTYPPTMYGSLADSIEVAVSGPWYDPTDEEAIYAAFGQLVNNQDFLALAGAYASKGETLQAAIAGDMNAGERAKVNAILTGKGIIYRV